MDKLLQDKVIVVSGGTKGIGKQIVIEGAKQGAKVVIGGRDKKSADEALDTVSSYGSEGIFVYTDLNNADDCEKLFTETMDKFGKVDGFVNYSGLLPSATLTESTVEMFDSVFNVNVRAAFFCCKHAVKCMQQNGGKGGSIVMFGSPHAWAGEKDRAVYACSKGAFLTLTNHIARNYAVDNIRSNFITMGWVPTEGELSMREKQGMNIEQLREFVKDFVPMGRMQEVEDHVPGVIYLLSDYATQVTGSNLCVTGGYFI